LPTKVKGNTYSQEVRNKIAEKRKFRKRWQMTRDPRLKTELNCISSDLRRTILNIKQQTIEAYLQGLTDDASTDYSLWKATKHLNRPTMSIPPLRKQERTWAKDDKEKAVVFAEHLERTFQTNGVQLLDNLRRREGTPIQQIPLVTPTELLNTINPKKAPGFDLLIGVILKHFPKKAIVKLTNLYNAALRLIYVPSYWKVAEVIMIPNQGSL